jgi:hypothetical protein
MQNSLVHRIGDSDALASQFTKLYEDRNLLQKLRAACIKERMDYTWKAAGERLKAAYQEAIGRSTLVSA